MRAVPLLLVAVLLGGCSGAMTTTSATTTSPPAAQPESTVADDLPPPDPAFAKHFTDPLYSDLGGEFAPFGTDEGFDMLYDWVDRRSELGPDSTVVQLLAGTGFEGMVATLDVPEGRHKVPLPGGQVDAATIVIGAGFTLLRLTGHIDDRGKQLTLKALDALIGFYGPEPDLVRQRDDLLSWQS